VGEPIMEAVTQADRATLEQMLDTRRQRLASCERMIELLQPEWDKFEARTGHDIYVTRDYADHTSAARTHRKEIAALEAALSHTNEQTVALLRSIRTYGCHSGQYHALKAADNADAADALISHLQGIDRG
jgi:hypothetical protein